MHDLKVNIKQRMGSRNVAAKESKERMTEYIKEMKHDVPVHSMMHFTDL